MTGDFLSWIRATLVSQLSKSVKGFPTRPWETQHKCCFTLLPRSWLSTRSDTEELPPIRQIIGKDEMVEIIRDYEKSGRDGSGYVVIDVRDESEVEASGKLSPGVITLPVPIILKQNVFALNDKEFEKVCGFEKPELDQTLVFSCAMGVRSCWAAYAAAVAGYDNVANYTGGANEWFN